MKIEEYRAKGFYNFQLYQIERAIKLKIPKTIIDKYIANPNLNNLQMEVIIDGYINDLNIDLYCDYNIPYEQMLDTYNKLLEEKNNQKAIETTEKVVKKGIKISKIMWHLIIFVFISLFIFVLIVVIYPLYQLQKEDLRIILKDDNFKIEYGEKFNIKEYIKEIKGKNPDITYPDIDSFLLGEKQYDIIATNGFKKQKTVFKINVIDKKKPEIIFKEKEIKIYEDEISNFKPINNVASVSDNADKNISKELIKFEYKDIKKGNNEIYANLKDKSGNKTVEMFILNVVEKPKPVVIEKPVYNNSNNNHSEPGNNNQSNRSENNPPKSTNPAIYGVRDISVALNSDLSDMVFQLSNGITATGYLTIDYSSVNLSVPGSYQVNYYSDDGASATCIVHVN